MTHAHNILLRGLNSICQQAPNVHDPKDISDLLRFCWAWCITVDHHHETEEERLFPDLEELTKQSGLMEVNKNQHKAFHDGLHECQVYAEKTTPEEYSWDASTLR